MQNKNEAKLSSFYIFNLRDSVKDISREKLWFDSGKKKGKWDWFSAIDPNYPSLMPFHSQDIILFNNSPYCLPSNSLDFIQRIWYWINY